MSLLLCWINRDGKAIETVNKCGNTELSKVSTRWRLYVGAKVNRQLFYRSAEYKMTKIVQKTQRSAFTYWCAQSLPNLLTSTETAFEDRYYERHTM